MGRLPQKLNFLPNTKPFIGWDLIILSFFLVNVSRLFAPYVLVRLHTFVNSGNLSLTKLVNTMAVNWFITVLSVSRDLNTKVPRVLTNVNVVMIYETRH